MEVQREELHAPGRAVRAQAIRQTLEGSSLAVGVKQTLSQTAHQSDVVEASLRLLELLDVQRSDSIHGIREHLRDHVRGG